MLDVPAILATLRRNGLGALLIALQMALTVAIVCNSLSIIQQRLASAQRPTGIDEANIFIVDNRWVGDPGERRARLAADMAALRALPGVIDATATYSVPLRSGGENGWVTLRPDQKPPTAWTGTYYVDEHTLRAFGARLVSGRWADPGDVGLITTDTRNIPNVAVVTRSLANAMYPAGDALGMPFYYVGFPLRIVGIIDTLQAPLQPLSFGESFIENSLLIPAAVVFNDNITYLVHTVAGQRDALMSMAAKRLLEVSRSRVIEKVQPYAAIRSEAYRGARAVSLILGTVSALLLIVTALGIVGLTSYWVGQRRRQIGVRRALGASRADILSYFHTENLLISGCGACVGVTTALVLNAQLTSGLQIEPMRPGFAVAAALILFALSQAAVAWPAWRAASLPPALAARGA